MVEVGWNAELFDLLLLQLLVLIHLQLYVFIVVADQIIIEQIYLIIKLSFIILV